MKSSPASARLPHSSIASLRASPLHDHLRGRSGHPLQVCGPPKPNHHIPLQSTKPHNFKNMVLAKIVDPSSDLNLARRRRKGHNLRSRRRPRHPHDCRTGRPCSLSRCGCRLLHWSKIFGPIRIRSIKAQSPLGITWIHGWKLSLDVHNAGT